MDREGNTQKIFKLLSFKLCYLSWKLKDAIFKEQRASKAQAERPEGGVKGHRELFPGL